MSELTPKHIRGLFLIWLVVWSGFLLPAIQAVQPNLNVALAAANGGGSQLAAITNEIVGHSGIDTEILNVIRQEGIVENLASERLFDLQPLVQAMQDQVTEVSSAAQGPLRRMASTLTSDESLMNIQFSARRALRELGIPRNERNDLENVFTRSNSPENALERLDRFFERHNPYMSQLVERNRILLQLQYEDHSGALLVSMIVAFALTILYVVLMALQYVITAGPMPALRRRIFSFIFMLARILTVAGIAAVFFSLGENDEKAKNGAFIAGIAVPIVMVAADVNIMRLANQRRHPSPAIEMQSHIGGPAREERQSAVDEIAPMLRTTAPATEEICPLCIEQLVQPDLEDAGPEPEEPNSSPVPRDVGSDHISELPCNHQIHEQCLRELLLHPLRQHVSPECIYCLRKFTFDELKTFGAQRSGQMVEVPLVGDE